MSDPRKPKPTLQTLALASLVEDTALYPRHAVDDANVRSLALALESGSQLPPIVADATSLRIVDGWHRARAYRRFHGPGATVEVELRHYESEAAMMEDAVSLNSCHGRRLDAIDQTRAVLMLTGHGVAPARIALIMHLPPEKVEKLRVRTATVPAGSHGRDVVPGTARLTLKRSVAHMHDQELSPEQAAAHATMPGTSFLLIARQLLLALKTGLADLKDSRLVGELLQLRAELLKLP